MPQNPKDKLSMIMCDADLAHLGRDVYFIRSEMLRYFLIFNNNE